jgi:TRAP-type mannitol/chloroaromatic compound transport system permease small subunit
MALVDRVVGGLATTLLVAAGLGVMLGMVVGTIDVVSTQVFLAPVHGATEGITELMVIIVFLSLPHVQRIQANIRVELLYSRFTVRTRAALDVVAAVAALAFFGLVVWQGIGVAEFSWRIRESTMSVVRIPIYPAKFAILVGATLTVVQAMIDVVARTRVALRSAR